MSNRRKFILQSSLATAAMIAAKPFNALAKFSSPLLGGSFNYNNITFLHTSATGYGIASKIRKATSKAASVVMLHDGPGKDEKEQQLDYDASSASVDAGYKVIYKDNIRVGVITAGPATFSGVHELSAFLKKEKACHLVVCISQLGFRNKNTIDDITLANKSEHIDIIVGKYAPDSPKRAYIAINKKKAEVIIHHTEDSTDALGKIKIGFNKAGNKYNVSF